MSRQRRRHGVKKKPERQRPSRRTQPGRRPEGPGVGRSMFAYGMLALAFTLAIELITASGLWVAWLLGVNATTLVAYSLDKQAAVRNHWRVPELVLHTLAALGGSPAAFAGRALLRHKSRDERFGRVLLAIGGAHACLLVGLTAWFVR